MTTISNFSEFNLIERFSQRFTKNLDPEVTGIGDDCAVVPWTENESLVATTDMLVQDTHFIKEAISPYDLGYKSLSVNLSDIAAMGAVPTFAFLSLALPKEIELEWIDSFFSGLGDLADQFNVKLLGGDTTCSKKSIVINLTLLGKVQTQNLKYRSMAQNRDVVCVTGHLGDSAAGLRALLEKKIFDEDLNFLIQRHHRPQIYLREAAWLSKQKSVHAMMDISDGIDSDIRHILKKSNCGCIIRLDEIPLSQPLMRSSKKFNWDMFTLALSGGEDYSLLLTVNPNDFFQVNKAYKKEFNSSLFPIGCITDQRGKLSYQLNGEDYILIDKGFDHFQTPQSTEAQYVSDVIGGALLGCISAFAIVYTLIGGFLG